MKNSELIAEAALKNGIYSQSEIDSIIKKDGELPLHTATAWNKKGYKIKNNERPLFSCRLWRFRPAKNASDTDSGYYCKNAEIFGINQVEEI